MFKASEKIINSQNLEKRESNASFDRNTRLIAHEIALDAFTSMATMEVELVEARKTRKVDERRIKNKILDEYDSLVNELVREIAILRNRFREYQLSNLNDIQIIMTESKAEHLVTMETNENLSSAMRNAISTILKHDEEIKSYCEDNFELKMTILKLRSMYTMKDQGAKSSFQAKVKIIAHNSCEF